MTTPTTKPITSTVDAIPFCRTILVSKRAST